MVAPSTLLIYHRWPGSELFLDILHFLCGGILKLKLITLGKCVLEPHKGTAALVKCTRAFIGCSRQRIFIAQ